MTRRLLLSYLSITLFVLLVLEVPLGIVFARSERDDMVSRVKQDALVLALLAEETLEGTGHADLQRLATEYQEDTGGRVVFLDGDATVLADSDPVGDGARSFADRPEVIQALTGEVASGWRHSDTLGTDLLYVAVPIASQGRVLGVVRITYDASLVANRIRRTWLLLGGVAAVVLGVVAIISLRLARSVTRPLREVEVASARLGAGDLGARAIVPEGPTEIRVLAEEFNLSADRLEHLVDAQKAFVSDASHQLRTPLAALRLRLENIQAAAGPDVDEDVDGALAEVRRLARLVDALLAMARVEHEGTALAAVDVREVVAARLAAWSALAQERGVELADGGAGPVVAEATPGKLDQVLDNLLANAMDVSPPGAEILVRCGRDKERVVIEVLDQGPGMTEDEQARAFDRFWQAPASRSQDGGTGLGLPIVRRLVESDGGDVALASRDSGGLAVSVRLRAAPEGTVP